MPEFTLITGRTVAQGEAMEKGKELNGFTKSTARVELDPEDMAKLGIKEGDTVRLETSEGSVAVAAAKSRDAPHWGVVFIPLGPWANLVIGGGTDGTGMPPFKGIKARIEVAPKEKVLTASELVELNYSKFLKEKEES